MVKYTTKVWLTVVGDITDVPLQTSLNKGIMPYVYIWNLLFANRIKIPYVSHFLTGEQLSEHQRKRAIGEVRFANVNLCKSFM